MSGRRLIPLLALTAVLRVAAPAAGETVDVTATDGKQLIAELTGATGPGVVLAHGDATDGAGLGELARTLAAGGFRPLLLDLRGQGASSGPADAAAIDRDVEGAYRYLLGRKIRPVFLVGTGAAGAAALAVTRRVPVAGVVVVASPSAPAAADVPVLLLADEKGAARLADDAVRARVLAFLRRPPAADTVSP